jgi:hypothetical protein
MIALRLPLLLLACCAAAQAVAQITVVSPRPDAVTVTIYRQGVAQITEMRQVELPAGPVGLVFEGVVDTLLPQSAVITGADRAVAETNFDFDQLSPGALLERSAGKAVTIIRTNRRTGAVVRQAATIISASRDDGVVIRTADGHESLKCSGLPERLEFNEIPDNLRTRPALSVRLASGVPGKRRVTVSYLVHGISWSADYVARLNQKADHMNLVGWATLSNETSSSFEQAQVQLVSGELELQYGTGGSRPPYTGGASGPEGADQEANVARLDEPLPQLPLEKCSATSRPPPVVVGRFSGDAVYSDEDDELNEIMVTGTRINRRESLGDYKLYLLPEPTDLNSHQTKQAAFLGRDRVRVERFYKLESRDFEPDDRGVEYSLSGPRVALKWSNTRAAGLGDPLPGGQVRVFEIFGGREVFAGTGKIADKPVGLDVELLYGQQLGLVVERTRDPVPQRLYELPRASIKVLHRLINTKSAPVTVLVQHNPSGGWWPGVPRVKHSNIRPQSAAGVPVWRIRIPAGSERVLSYEIEAENLGYAGN